MKNPCNGFTLLELLVAVGILSLLTAFSLPPFAAWLEDARYRESASRLTAALREGRARAISSNLEHRVEIDLVLRKFRTTRGNRAERSTESSFENNVLIDWNGFPAGLLKANKECDGAAENIKYHFNPNGTGSFRYVCIVDEKGEKRYRVGVPFPVTGKIITQKWAKNGWK